MGRRKGYKAEVVERWIKTIDRCLARFREELPKSELKLTDYMRLTELESIAATDGKGEVIVRWVDCEAEEEADDDR
jgi:hypothetical protein